VGNSDMHDIRQIGRTFTLVDAPHDVGAICDAVRRGSVQVRSEPVPYDELARVFSGLMIRGWINQFKRQQAGDRLTAHAGRALRLPDAS
jgi:hypothetical protein